MMETLNLKQAAAFLKMHPVTVQGKARAGEIPAAKPGKCWAFIKDALRDWTYKRSLRQQGVAELRSVWQEALNDKTSDISPEEVLDRLERKYQAIVDGASTTK